MSLLKRLKQLEAAVDETGLDEIMVAPGWVEYVCELEQALPKLLAVVEAAKDFINSDGDYFAWTEDERHCMSRLRDALAALEEGE